MRKLTSYLKVQRLIGAIRRNRAFQVSQEMRQRSFLHIGCGPQILPHFVNVDYRWLPGIELVWDISSCSLPFADGHFTGIFSEHCLEHFDLERLNRILKELRRVLRLGGRIRLVLPSLEAHVKAYLAGLGNASGSAEAADRINRVFYSGHDWMAQSHWYNDGHHFIHDFASIQRSLEEAGFTQIEECSFQVGTTTNLLVDKAERAWESLYVEAVRS